MSCFGFLQVLSRIPLVVLGDPLGCPRQQDLASNFRNALGLQEDMAAGQGCLDALAIFAYQ
jgi:hypothetical protein